MISLKSFLLHYKNEILFHHFELHLNVLKHNTVECTTENVTSGIECTFGGLILLGITKQPIHTRMNIVGNILKFSTHHS